MSVTYGGDKITFDDGTSIASGLTHFRNRIINGDMRIDQRNAGSAVTPSDNAFTLDRWAHRENGSGAYTVQRSTTVPSGQGFTNSILATVTTADSSIASDEIYSFLHKIEGFNTADFNWGTASAKPITLSFWVRSSHIGTYSVGFLNIDANRGYAASYTINSADTWEYKTITISGDTTGTWHTDNRCSIQISFCLGCGTGRTEPANSWVGSNVQGADGTFNWMANLNATFYLTGVQLEVGSYATSFERRPYTTELQLCQRYLPKVGFDTDDQIGVGQATGSGTWAIQIPHIVQPRVAPTGISAGTASNFNVINSTASGVAVTAINFSAGGLSGSRVTGSVSSGLTAGNATILRAQNSSGFILFTGCEL
jgi:hypothetical protein